MEAGLCERIKYSLGNAERIVVCNEQNIFRKSGIGEDFSYLCGISAAYFNDLCVEGMLSAAGAVFKTFKNCIKIHNSTSF